jgi:hypothetical protein
MPIFDPLSMVGNVAVNELAGPKGMSSLIETAILNNTTGAALDLVAVNQYNSSLRYWDSSAKAADLSEAIGYILGNFNRVNTIAGKSWTREDLTKLLDKADASRESQETAGGANPKRAMFTRGICKL